METKEITTFHKRLSKTRGSPVLTCRSGESLHTRETREENSHTPRFLSSNIRRVINQTAGEQEGKTSR